MLALLVANLSVRKIDDQVCERLRARAARHGVSMEEEVRRILTAAVAPPERLGSFIVGFFGEENGVDLEIPPREIVEPRVRFE
jgi:plasmid stability protein